MHKNCPVLITLSNGAIPIPIGQAFFFKIWLFILGDFFIEMIAVMSVFVIKLGSSRAEFVPITMCPVSVIRQGVVCATTLRYLFIYLFIYLFVCLFSS